MTCFEMMRLISGQVEDDAYEENQVTQEMLEEQMLRLLTREVMDLLSKFSSFASVFENRLKKGNIVVLFYQV